MANVENKNFPPEDPEKPHNSDKISVGNAKELVRDAIQHPVETAKEISHQAAKDVSSYKWWAKLLLILFWLGIILFSAFIITINLPVTKNWVAKRVVESINTKMKSQISFENINVNYFGDITIDKITIKDDRNFPFLKAEQLYADSDWLSIIDNSQNLQFQSLALHHLDLKVITYKNDSISNFVRFTNLFNQTKKDPNKKPFELTSRISILDSKVSIINENSGEKGKWLTATDLNIIAPELKVRGSTVNAKINRMSFVAERWGKKHFLQTFSTNLTYTDQFLKLEDLLLYTDHSLLQGELTFKLPATRFQDFADKVVWDMTVKKGSYISGYDISYFVTQWDNYQPVNLDGKMDGTLNDFKLKNFALTNPKVKIYTSALHANKLLKGDFTIESSDLRTDFTYVDLKKMMPTFIAAKMKNFADPFGRMQLAGAVRVQPKQIYVQKASLLTGIGRALLRQFYLTDFSTRMPKYRGEAQVWNFNTAAITRNNTVGLLTGQFSLQGESFDVSTMRIRTKSTIQSIQIAGKELNNITLNGLLDYRTYRGLITINDEQARGTVDGFIDFKTKKITADIDARLNYLNINYFSGQPGNQILSGNFDGKVSMTNLNDLYLDMDISEARFANGQDSYLIPRAKVETYLQNDGRVLLVDAPGTASAKLTGHYSLADLPAMVQSGLSKILVGPAPRKSFAGQYFNVEVDAKQDLLSYFMPEIRIPQGLFVNGSYNGNSNNLVLNLTAPELHYHPDEDGSKMVKDGIEYLVSYTNDGIPVAKTTDHIIAKNLTVRINTADLTEQLFARVDRLQTGNNIFKDLIITGRNEDNKMLHLTANLLHGTPEQEAAEQLKKYAVNLNQTTNTAGDYVIRFEPTTVQMNNVAWQIDTDAALDHSITYRKKTKDFALKNIRVFSDDSELFIKDGVFRSAKEFNLDAEVKNFQLSKILEMQEEGNGLQMTGVANGSAKIRMHNGNLEPLVNLEVADIFMKGEDLGDLKIEAAESGRPNIFNISAVVTSAGIIGGNNLTVQGTVDNNTASPTLDISADMREFDLKFANQFVKNVFSNMRGKANGTLRITGPLKDINYSGDIALKNFGLKLNFTGVDYSLDDTVVSLSRGAAILNDVGVHDGRNNSSGTLSGAIYFETLSSMAVELIMRAENLLVLNSTQQDNDLFFGRVYGQGNLFISGPVSGLKISTDSNDPFKTLNNSVFTFNSNSTSNLDEFKMLRFLTEDETGAITVKERPRGGANMLIDFTVAVDRGTQVNVLVGDDIGDISVRGVAKPLHFHMSREGNISMSGTYAVESGTYVSKAILNRTFQISKGSSISWESNPLNPQLDITANYLRTVSNAADYLNVQSLQPINVLLQAKISQTLTNPKINLEVIAQDVSSQIREALSVKMSQEDERLVQFGSILLLNRFNVASSGGLFSDVSGIAESSGYNLLLRQLGSVLNTISNEFQIDLNYVKGDQASNTNDRANAGVKLSLSPRLNIKTGVGIPLSRSAAETSLNYLSGEGTIEYDLSKNNDGTFLIRGYSKPMNVGMVGANAANNQAYGAGVVWSRSFNRLIGKGRNKNKKNKALRDKVKVDSVQ